MWYKYGIYIYIYISFDYNIENSLKFTFWQVNLQNFLFLKQKIIKHIYLYRKMPRFFSFFKPKRIYSFYFQTKKSALKVFFPQKNPSLFGVLSYNYFIFFYFLEKFYIVYYMQIYRQISFFKRYYITYNEVSSLKKIQKSQNIAIESFPREQSLASLVVIFSILN